MSAPSFHTGCQGLTAAADAGPAGPGDEWPKGYSKTLVITQGTVDNADQNKLIIPALEAVKDMDALVIVATGGRGTDGPAGPLPAAQHPGARLCGLRQSLRLY